MHTHTLSKKMKELKHTHKKKKEETSTNIRCVNKFEKSSFPKN